MAVGFGAISQIQGEPNLMSAFRKLLREVIHTTNTMQYFLMPLMRAILLKHFGPSIFQEKPGTTIKDAPGLYDFWISFFAENAVRDRFVEIQELRSKFRTLKRLDFFAA
jgi:hypothetical protein